MCALPLLGHAAKGATRWVEVSGFTLQPSEFMKPALIVLVAWMFAEGQKGEGVPGVSIAFGLYVVAVVLLLIEPDIGQTVLITVAFGAAFWMAGVPMSWVMAWARAAIGRPVQHLFPVPARGHARRRVLQPRQDRHLADPPRRRGHRRGPHVRPRTRRRDHEDPRARHAHRLRLFRRRRGIRPVAVSGDHRPVRLPGAPRPLQGDEAHRPLRAGGGRRPCSCWWACRPSSMWR